MTTPDTLTGTAALVRRIQDANRAEVASRQHGLESTDREDIRDGLDAAMALVAEAERLTQDRDTYEQECAKLNRTIDTLAAEVERAENLAVRDVARLTRERNEAYAEVDRLNSLAAETALKLRAANKDLDRWRDKARRRKEQRDDARERLGYVRILAQTLQAKVRAMRPVMEAVKPWAESEGARSLSQENCSAWLHENTERILALLRAWYTYNEAAETLEVGRPATSSVGVNQTAGNLNLPTEGSGQVDKT